MLPASAATRSRADRSTGLAPSRAGSAPLVPNACFKLRDCLHMSTYSPSPRRLPSVAAKGSQPMSASSCPSSPTSCICTDPSLDSSSKENMQASLWSSSSSLGRGEPSSAESPPAVRPGVLQSDEPPLGGLLGEYNSKHTVGKYSGGTSQ